MKIFGLEMRKAPKTFNVQRSTFNAQLTELEINRALATVPATHPCWAAIAQLIDTAETNANENAASTMFSDIGMAGYVGGAQHLRMLRDELQNRRAQGLAELRSPAARVRQPTESDE